MSDASIFINESTPGYKLATINRTVPEIGVLFDKPYSGLGGLDSYSPVITVSDVDSLQIEKHTLIDIDGEVTRFRAAANPELDGTGLAYVKLEEYYE